MKRIIPLLLFAFISTTNCLRAQLTSGSIKMGITDFAVSGPEDGVLTDQVGNMMKGMTMTINFRPGEQVTVIDMMGMMNMQQHFKDGMMIQYMDMMGQKIMIKTPMGPEMLKDMGMTEADLKEAYQVNYDKSSTKKILGYDCYKATIKMDLNKVSQGQEMPEGMSDMNMTLYVSKDIKLDNFAMQQLPGIQLDGAPLSMEMDMGMMTMTYEALEINKTVDPSIFEKPEGNYREMSLEDLQKMGMGSSGFGF